MLEENVVSVVESLYESQTKPDQVWVRHTQRTRKVNGDLLSCHCWTCEEGSLSVNTNTCAHPGLEVWAGGGSPSWALDLTWRVDISPGYWTKSYRATIRVRENEWSRTPILNFLRYFTTTSANHIHDLTYCPWISIKWDKCWQIYKNAALAKMRGRKNKR